jgi:hypothetical protein
MIEKTTPIAKARPDNLDGLDEYFMWTSFLPGLFPVNHRSIMSENFGPLQRESWDISVSIVADRPSVKVDGRTKSR